MSDDLRAAAERVVNVALLSIERDEPEHFLVGDFIDAFLASPECLALAVREACRFFANVDWHDGSDKEPAYIPRPDVAALLGGD